MSNYDAWKLAGGGDRAEDGVADACTDAERYLTERLTRVVEAMHDAKPLQSPLSAEWEIDEVVADVDDTGEVRAEIAFRVAGVPVEGSRHGLREIAQRFADFAARLNNLADAGNDAIPPGKMAPSARSYQAPESTKTA